MTENVKSELVDMPISALKARRSNPRTHGKMQIRKIADSIQKFGFVTPVLIDAGHGRLVYGVTDRFHDPHRYHG